MGAGRSGSTILSTILGASDEIFNCADLMQFYMYACLRKACNDGENVFDSKFWSKVIKLYDSEKIIDYCKIASLNRNLEKHTSIFKNYFTSNLSTKSSFQDYINQQSKLIECIASISDKAYILDSSKYVNRALLLSKQKKV